MDCFSIDIETTGLDPARNGVIEFGAIMFNLFDRAAPKKSFVRYINPENMVWSQYCLKLHAAWLDRVNYRIEHGQLEQQPQIQVGYTLSDDEMKNLKISETFMPKICKNFAEMQLDFLTWLYVECGFQPPDESGKWEEKIVPAGKNFASFDRPFLLNNGFPVRLLHHRAVDPGPLYIMKGDKVPPEFKTCKERCKEFATNVVAHTALEDAQDVITLLHSYYAPLIHLKTSDIRAAVGLSTITCSACNGTGGDGHGEPCGVCMGTGVGR